MKRLIVLILFLFFIQACTKQLLVKNYPLEQPSFNMYGGTPERSFYYPLDFPDSLQLIWNESVKGSFHNNSVLAEGNYVFTSDLAANVFCFDIESGKTIGADKGKGEMVVSPILNNGTLYYIITQTDETYSLLIRYDVRKGERLKEIKIPGRVSNEIMKMKKSFIFVTDDGIVFNYDFFLQQIWKIELNKKVYSSPASTSDNLYITTFSGNFITINIADGKIENEISIDSKFESALVINENTCYLGSVEGDVFSIDLLKQSINWKISTGSKIISPVVHNNKYGFIGNLDGTLICFDLISGAKIWGFKSEGMFNAPGALFNNLLIQPDVNKKLLFINPKDGVIKEIIEYDARVKLHPLYFRDYLFVGVDRGELYCYKLIKQ